METIFRQEYAGAISTVNVLDEPGAGNACHSYHLINARSGDTSEPEVFHHIDFQDGPVLEAGVNGIHNEQLLAVVIHRLQGFQSGPFACRENALALTKLQEALMWLKARTEDRVTRGVEGKNQL